MKISEPQNQKLAFNDISIVPSETTIITSRAQVYPFLEYYKYQNTIPNITKVTLPIFTSPMNTVVNTEYAERYENAGIIPIIPRTDSLMLRVTQLFGGKVFNFNSPGNYKKRFVSFSLKEFKQLFVDMKEPISRKEEEEEKEEKEELEEENSTRSIKDILEQSTVTESEEYGIPLFVLIDCANGHMEDLYTSVDKARENIASISHGKYRLVIMLGNIANPLTYYTAVKHKIDFIRVGIGTGCACTTTAQTGVGYPIISLISEIQAIRQKLLNINQEYTQENLPKIICDGGIRCYADVIKALSVGADFVMIGSEFAKLLDSPGEISCQFYVTPELTGLKYWFEQTNGSSINKKNCILFKYMHDEDMTYNEYMQLFQDYNLNSFPMFKEYYGMASEKGYTALGNKKKNTISTRYIAEGMHKLLPVSKLTIDEWGKSLIQYLRSAMTYCDSMTLDEFKEKATHVVVSNSAYQGINSPLI